MLRARQKKYEGYLKQERRRFWKPTRKHDGCTQRMVFIAATMCKQRWTVVAEYEVTNHNTDQGLLNTVCQQAKEHLGVEIIVALSPASKKDYGRVYGHENVNV